MIAVSLVRDGGLCQQQVWDLRCSKYPLAPKLWPPDRSGLRRLRSSTKQPRMCAYGCKAGLPPKHESKEQVKENGYVQLIVGIVLWEPLHSKLREAHVGGLEEWISYYDLIRLQLCNVFSKLHYIYIYIYDIYIYINTLNLRWLLFSAS